MAKDAQDALAEGLAVGFVGGALAGWQFGKLPGFDLMAPGGWTWRTLVGWGCLPGGPAAGKGLSLQGRARRATAKE